MAIFHSMEIINGMKLKRECQAVLSHTKICAIGALIVVLDILACFPYLIKVPWAKLYTGDAAIMHEVRQTIWLLTRSWPTNDLEFIHTNSSRLD